MPKSMPRQVGNEVTASAAKYLFEELFESAHDHVVKSSLPADNEGTSRDIVIVDDGTSVFICVKTTRGWFRTAALTAI